MRQTWRNFCGIAALGAGVLLTGCGTNGNSNVRVVNASPGLSVYTVQVGVTGIAANVPYGKEGVQQPGQYTTLDASGNYRPIGAGTNQKLVVYGATPSNVLTSSTKTTVKSTAYTFVTVGPAPKIALLVLTDNGTTPANGDAGLRVVHASSTAGAVDVYVTAPGAPLSGTPTVSNISFNGITTYLPMAAGSYEVRVTPTGNLSKVVIDVTTTLSGGGLYTAYALDPPAGGTGKFGLLLTGDRVTAGTTAATTTM